jgi:hypothetical protein
MRRRALSRDPNRHFVITLMVSQVTAGEAVGPESSTMESEMAAQLPDLEPLEEG